VRALPGVHDFLVTVAREIIFSRTWRQPRGARTTRLRRPEAAVRPRSMSALDTVPSIASRDLRFVTIGRNALYLARDSRYEFTISEKAKAKYFYICDWTVESVLILLANFDFSRKRFRSHDEYGHHGLDAGNIGGRIIRGSSTECRLAHAYLDRIEHPAVRSRTYTLADRKFPAEDRSLALFHMAAASLGSWR
jgi:hypothetical protein